MFYTALQNYTANVSIDASTVRGYQSGTLSETRRFLQHIDLADASVRSEEFYLGFLEQKTTIEGECYPSAA